MNLDNYNYLKDQVKFAGFGEALDNQLKEQIERQEPTFQLKYDHEFGKDQVQAVLNFRKSDQADRYFFNSYDITVKPHKEEESVSQTFYIGRANNYTVKEAYNMMCGRAVYKELEKLEKVGDGSSARLEPNGEKYHAWVQLDFKNTDERGNYKISSFHENYGFNLKEALAKLPIQQLNNEKDQAELVRSLEKGNRQFVTFIKDGDTENRYLQANPQYKTVTVFDANMKRLRLDQPESDTIKKNGQSAKQERRQGQNEGAKPEKKSKRNKVKI